MSDTPPRLDPCVWCASFAASLRTPLFTLSRPQIFYVECKTCGAQGPRADSAAVAETLWNQRTVLDVISLRTRLDGTWGHHLSRTLLSNGDVVIWFDDTDPDAPRWVPGHYWGEPGGGAWFCYQDDPPTPAHSRDRLSRINPRMRFRLPRPGE